MQCYLNRDPVPHPPIFCILYSSLLVLWRGYGRASTGLYGSSVHDLPDAPSAPTSDSALGVLSMVVAVAAVQVCGPATLYSELATPLVFDLGLDPGENWPLMEGSNEYIAAVAAATSATATTITARCVSSACLPPGLTPSLFSLFATHVRRTKRAWVS